MDGALDLEQRTISMAIGDSGISFLPALRRAFSSISVGVSRSEDWALSIRETWATSSESAFS
ncbi:hypothetical protein [Reyranella sp. CPCC 100927]|uniref:hypothetical protein n=1 Tax=Reyranella sp. CPCC 100927 TaxID=2599616 RepID=UPI0015B38562|nr:hypothetical protein [Reyranella sp. CPCC 100927]